MLVKKSDFLQIRLEPELYSSLKALADSRKTTVSRMVRELIEHECTLHAQIQATKPLLGTSKYPVQIKKAQKPKPIVSRYTGVKGSSLLAGLINKAK